MSGFERSAPVPGSQGPRRSQMHRYNNAPPPESPWRLEVLEAKRAAEAAMRKASQRDHSRSRSRDRDRERERPDKERGDRDRRKAGGKKVEEVSQQESLAKKIVRAREVGEGWFAAVSAASSAWDSVPEQKKAPGGKAMHDGGAGASDKRRTDERRKPELSAREKEALAREEKARSVRGLEEEGRRREDQKSEQERLEKQWAAEAEARDRRRIEEKKKAEEEKRLREQQEKQRRSKLGNAFAMDDDEEDTGKREAELLKKASERKRSINEATSVQQSLMPMQHQDVSSFLIAETQKPKGDKELANKLGFDGALDPAEAFIRLQERKRKGRRTEFGGPPRGCSPWRDGKRGVITPIAQSRIEREESSRR